jgi:nucleoside-diphosphate-sugar epimerase
VVSGKPEGIKHEKTSLVGSDQRYVFSTSKFLQYRPSHFSPGFVQATMLIVAHQRNEMAVANKVVLIGGAGFIGSQVARELISAGTRVSTLAGPPDEPRSINFPVDGCVYADITDSIRFLSLFVGAGTVVHAAGPSSVADSFNRESEYKRVHTIGTAAVLQACQSTGVKRIVYISSAEVYGNSAENFLSESLPMIARSPYGMAKIGGEHLVRSCASAGDMEAVILRPFCVYGPGMSQNGVVAQILAQAAKGSPIKVCDTRPVRDFCYVTDVARAVVTACTIPVDRLAIINLGSGKPTSVGEVARLAAELAGAPGMLETGDKRLACSEIFRSIADTRVAKQLLNWQAGTSLREGLTQTLAWMRTR